MYLLSFCLCFLFTSSLGAASYRASSDCIFAVLTYKTGIASAFSHNHFIIHPLPDLKIEAATNVWFPATFDSEFKVKDLVVDDFQLIKKWSTKLIEWKLIQEGDYSEQNEKTRSQVKEAMLDEDQLDSAHFPMGRVELLRLKKIDFFLDSGQFPFEVEGAITLRGKRNMFRMGAFVKRTATSLYFEGAAKIKISDFGIKPFSSFLGAVGNQDEMSLFTYCIAHKI